MRGINFFAGLGTILIFMGVFFFKAVLQKNKIKDKENRDWVNHAPVKNSRKFLLLLIGSLCILSGILLIVKSIREI